MTGRGGWEFLSAQGHACDPAVRAGERVVVHLSIRPIELNRGHSEGDRPEA
jgi:hypothetical protein